jgi:hypothetical protein
MIGNCSYANAEISKIYLTPWSSSVIPYFDTDGSKISSLTGLTDIWTEIVLNTASVKYTQSLNAPGPNGITYEEKVTLIFPNADADKWAELTSVLKDRYIIIFKDANENWYILGWRFGTKVLAYTLEDNEYSLTFQNSFTTNLLTSIDVNYINQYVI